MKIGVLGTGMVGNTVGSRLIQLGHQVKMGSRTSNNAKAADWINKTGSANASQGNFADAATFGEVLFNCTSGAASLEVMKLAGAGLKGKILVDISNPLDFSKGMPPSLSICNTDSLGEQIQKAHPDTKVVKSLNTMNCNLMVNPSLLKEEHDVFLCGNDADAKAKVKELLNSFGWKSPIDLGDITAARGTEMILPVWLRLMGTLGTANFNFKIVK